MTLAVSCRLRLGGVISEFQDKNLITFLIKQVYLYALCRPLLFCVDGLGAYISAIRDVFRSSVRIGNRGRPRLLPWKHICVAQVIKEVSMKGVVRVVRRVA